MHVHIQLNTHMYIRDLQMDISLLYLMLVDYRFKMKVFALLLTAIILTSSIGKFITTL